MGAVPGHQAGAWQMFQHLWLLLLTNVLTVLILPTGQRPPSSPSTGLGTGQGLSVGARMHSHVALGSRGGCCLQAASLLSATRSPKSHRKPGIRTLLSNLLIFKCWLLLQKKNGKEKALSTKTQVSYRPGLAASAALSKREASWKRRCSQPRKHGITRCHVVGPLRSPPRLKFLWFDTHKGGKDLQGILWHTELFLSSSWLE